MRYVQTLYSGTRADFLVDDFGWYAPEYHLMSWALSCLRLKAYYPSLTLYADAKSADLLINKLKLPYDNVKITHDDLTLPHEQLWAMAKIYTYSLQREPFLHIDGDVFLFRALPKRLSKASLIAQNIEESTEYYASFQKELTSKLRYFPPFVKEDLTSKKPIKAVNAGILGGNDLNFFRDYCDAAFEYVTQNEGILPSIGVVGFNIFLEQHLFYCLSRKAGVKIKCLLSDIIQDNRYRLLNEFEETPCTRTYLHLIGNFKRDYNTCSQMAKKLRQLYPSYYANIKKLFQTNNKPWHDVEPTLFYLNEVVQQMKKVDNYQKWKSIEADFNRFAKKVSNCLKCRFIDLELLLRNKGSANWYCQLFGQESEIENKQIVCCKEVVVIKSKYNWAMLFAPPMKDAMQVLPNLDLNFKSGEYFNLIVPENANSSFSIFDIDEIDALLLARVKKGKSIRSLILEMEPFFEKEVVVENRPLYSNMIIRTSKDLVKKRAIRPV